MATITITRTSFTDDSGSGTDGDVWNSTLIGTSLYDPIDALFDGSKKLYVDTNGLLALNDTANANMTTGLTINQGAADNQIQAFKSSDVSHGMTTLVTSPFDVEVDDWYAVGKLTSTGGRHEVIARNTGANYAMTEHWGGAPVTSDTAGSQGAVHWMVGQHDGANGAVDMAANSTAFTWGEYDTVSGNRTRMLLKADDGELHLGNTTLVALDDEDDVALVRAMQFEASGGEGLRPVPWDTTDHGVPPLAYERLRAIGVLGERDEHGFCLMNVQARFAMDEGAIWQLHCRQVETARALSARLDQIERRLPA